MGPSYDAGTTNREQHRRLALLRLNVRANTRVPLARSLTHASVKMPRRDAASSTARVLT